MRRGLAGPCGCCHRQGNGSVRPRCRSWESHTRSRSGIPSKTIGSGYPVATSSAGTPTDRYTAGAISTVGVCQPHIVRRAAVQLAGARCELAPSGWEPGTRPGATEGARRDQLNLAVAKALRARSAGAAQIAAHFLAAGPAARQEAIDYSIRAAREATARLGHDQACAHYHHALQLIGADAGDRDQERCSLLLELAAAQDRAGRTGSAEQCYREVGELAQRTGDDVAFANAALGLHSLGHRIGSSDLRALEMLRLAAARLAADDGSLALRSRVAGAEARDLRHGSVLALGNETIRAAPRAVRLAAESGVAHTMVVAELALQDSMWVPGTSPSVRARPSVRGCATRCPKSTTSIPGSPTTSSPPSDGYHLLLHTGPTDNLEIELTSSPRLSMEVRDSVSSPGTAGS